MSSLKQKYFRGHRIKIQNTMPSYMSHFECGCEAIVQGSYTDLCGKTDTPPEYSLLLLTDEPHSQVPGMRRTS